MRWPAQRLQKLSGWMPPRLRSGKIQRQNQADEKSRESLEKARQVNKSKFRL